MLLWGPQRLFSLFLPRPLSLPPLTPLSAMSSSSFVRSSDPETSSGSDQFSLTAPSPLLQNTDALMRSNLIPSTQRAPDDPSRVFPNLPLTNFTFGSSPQDLFTPSMVCRSFISLLFAYMGTSNRLPPLPWPTRTLRTSLWSPT